MAENLPSTYEPTVPPAPAEVEAQNTEVYVPPTAKIATIAVEKATQGTGGLFQDSPVIHGHHR